MATFDTSGRWLKVTDLGLDRLYVYQLDTTHETLAPNSTPYLQFERGAVRGISRFTRAVASRT